MNPSTISFLSFTLFLILFFRAPLLASGTRLYEIAPSPSSGTKLYEIVCRESGRDNDRCLKDLEADPRITSANNYLELCRAVLKMAIKRATKAQKYLKEVMLKKYPSSPAMKDCANGRYDALITSFESSLGELIEDPQTANYDARVAGDGPTICDSALADEKIADPSITTLNNEMFFLSYLAFLATNHIPYFPGTN